MTTPTIPFETNGLENPQAYHAAVTDQIERSVPWTEPGLYITRFRLLTDPGLPFFDVSYCHGRLPSGEFVDVDLPFHQLPRRGMSRAIVQHAIRDGVHAKKLGILSNVSILR